MIGFYLPGISELNIKLPNKVHSHVNTKSSLIFKLLSTVFALEETDFFMADE